MKKLNLSAVGSLLLALGLSSSVFAGPPATIDQLDWMPGAKDEHGYAII